MMLDQIKNNKVFYIIILLILMFFFHFSYYIAQVYWSSKNTAENNSYDAAVVLTGDMFRINKGISLLDNQIIDKLLISGVNKDINENLIKNIFKDDQLFACCIDQENKSRNTFENAKESYLWMNKNKYLSLVIISSDYHLPRSKLEFGRFFKNSNIIFIPSNKFLENVTLKKIFIEYIKYIRTNLSLLIEL
jgi:uncharacterized SAM-binding protein YcdF (DUF218 family)